MSYLLKVRAIGNKKRGWYNMKNGLIIDDITDSRYRLKKLLLRAYPNILISEYIDSDNAHKAITTIEYSIVLLDMDFQNGTGKELITSIKNNSPDTYIIVCSTFDDDKHLLSALHAGAYGYLLKDTSEKIIIDKLRGINIGDPPLSPGITRRLLRHYRAGASQVNHKNHHLSPRESEILIYISKGLSRKEISRLLSISDSTVAGYIRDIYRSLNISCRAEAAIQACRMGLIDPNKFH